MAYLTGKAVGFFDRNGIKPGTGNQTTGDDFNASRGNSAWPNSAYNANLGGFVMRSINQGGGIPWSELQTTAGTPAGSSALTGTAGAGISAIDHAFYVLDGYAATNPTNIWTGKLRLFMGEYAPSWAAALGVGPIAGGSVASTSAWWDTTYQAAFAQFMLKLAAYVPVYTVTTTNYGLALGANTQKLDGHPLFGEITESSCMTLFAETMMKDDYTNGTAGSTNAQNAGWTLNADFNLGAMTGSHISALNAMQAAFTTTPVSKSANPFVVINSNSKDEARTEALIDYLVGAGLSPTKTPNCGLTFPHAVMENNSLRANVASNCPGGATQNGGAYSDRNADYTSMYTKFAGYADGQAADDLSLGEAIQPMPLCIQTSTYSAMGATVQKLKDTVTYGTWLGMRMCELPGDSGGYTNITVGDSWWSGAIAALIANDPLSSGGIPPLSLLRRRHWRTFTHR